MRASQGRRSGMWTRGARAPPARRKHSTAHDDVRVWGGHEGKSASVLYWAPSCTPPSGGVRKTCTPAMLSYG